ncbi:PucR family transcriptional regulator [Wukongibacter sp. M2B1]|uniref:PucR family transcriptional regulator n=1 Tax=Wukongibacter sp. M2B1 TaxID=3088895 RepID=UPI003D7BB648
MCIRVCDILEMRILKKNRLLAGKGGLNNIVTGVNIYEYILKRTHDRTGELYLTSFYNIKEGGEDALLEHIQVLIDTNCPGLLMGAGAYADINEEIKNLADRNNFPIISIGEYVLYSDVLESTYKLILESNSVDNNSIILDRIMMLQDREIISKHVRQINTNFKDYYCALYFCCDKNKDMAYFVLDNELGCVEYNSLIKYEKGIVIIISSNKENSNIEKIIARALDNLSNKNINYHIGISNFYRDYKDFKKAITEARYAYITCDKISKKNISKISEIGIYQMLIPICENPAVLEYSRSVVNKVKEYDAMYNMDILNTVLMYIKCDNDIIKTSEKLFVHKNTIRYRLKKIETIIDNSNNDCMEQLSTSIRILRLIDEI